MNVDSHIYTTRDGKLAARLEWTDPATGRQVRYRVTPAEDLRELLSRIRIALALVMPPEVLREHVARIPRVPGTWS